MLTDKNKIIEVSEKKFSYGAFDNKDFLNLFLDSVTALGFKKCYIGTTFTDAQLNFVEPTLVCIPYMAGKFRQQSIFIKEALSHKFSTFGTVNWLARSAYTIQILDDAAVSAPIPLLFSPSNVVVGVYYPQRKVVILYFNPLAVYKRMNFIRVLCDEISSSMSRANINLQVPLTPEEIEKRKQLAIELEAKRKIELERKAAEDLKNMWKGFVLGIENEKRNAISSIEVSKNQIDNYNKKIAEDIDNMQAKETIISLLNNYLSSLPEEFNKKIEEIKTLPFVKSVELKYPAIIIDVGTIIITHQNKKYLIGEFKIGIEANKIWFKNDKMTDNHAHPHIRGNGTNASACMGTHYTPAMALLHSLRFKELVFFLYQYLNTYSQKGGPYYNISNWKVVESKATDLPLPKK